MTKDYYTFGSPMPGRSFNSNAYKYGFNGQLKDDEVYGSGNLNSAEYWEYDTRLGRRWNTDPVVKPWESPYACFSNNPIYYKDPSGLTAEGSGDKDKKGEGTAPVITGNNKNGYTIEGIGVTAEKTGFWSKVGNGIKKMWDADVAILKSGWGIITGIAEYLTSTGNYGTGHGGNGMDLYSSTVKRMSNALAELAEMFGVLKPTNKESIGGSPNKLMEKSDGKGLNKGSEEANKQGYAEQVDINNKQTEPALKQADADTIIRSQWQRLKDPNIVDTLDQTFDKKEYKEKGDKAKEKKRVWK